MIFKTLKRLKMFIFMGFILILAMNSEATMAFAWKSVKSLLIFIVNMFTRV